MHKSVLSECNKTNSSYFRHQFQISPHNTKHLSPLTKIPLKQIDHTHRKEQRLKTQSVYQIQDSIEDKRSLRSRINQKISKKASEPQSVTSRLNNHPQHSKMGETGKKQSQRLSCIRKMLFEDEAIELIKSKNKQNECVNKLAANRRRVKERSEFEERQKRQVQSRGEKAGIMRQEIRRKQLKECTFKPKLTKYTGFILNAAS